MDNVQQILTRIVIRNDSSINWESSNPVLLKGEMGIDTDLNKIKIGDGFKTWSELSYSSDSGYDDTQIKAAIKSNTDAISLLIGTKEGDDTKTIREIAADEINALIGGVNHEDAITNIATLIEYVNENGSEITGILKDISNIKTITYGLGGEGQPSTIIELVEQEIAAISTANLSIDENEIIVVTKGLVVPELDKFEVENGKVTKISTDLLSQGEKTLVLNGGSSTM